MGLWIFSVGARIPWMGDQLIQVLYNYKATKDNNEKQKHPSCKWNRYKGPRGVGVHVLHVEREYPPLVQVSITGATTAIYNNNSFPHSQLLHFGTMSIVRYSKYYKTQRVSFFFFFSSSFGLHISSE
jgi:hypothetical protein